MTFSGRCDVGKRKCYTKSNHILVQYGHANMYSKPHIDFTEFLLIVLT